MERKKKQENSCPNTVNNRWRWKMKKWSVTLGVFLCGCIIAVVLAQANGIGFYDRKDSDINTYVEVKTEAAPLDNEITTNAEKEVILNGENKETTSEETTKTTSEEAIKETPEEVTEKEFTAGPSMDKLMRLAIAPVGNTMYIWGGGWNEADDGAGIEAVTIGVSPRWAEYAAQQGADYNYRNTRYQIHDGLDCSGYIGWLVYNVMNEESGKEGYVMYACDMAKTYADYGWGTYMTSGDYKPGDICSMSGHVWLCLGTCSDGSVLLVHSSPPGVRICGTELPGGYDSQAIELAKEIMSTHYESWYNRYPDCSVDAGYLTGSVRMRWDTSVLPDENDIQNASGEQVAEYLFD